MPKKTLALIIGLIVLTIILLFAATRSGQSPKTTQPTPSTAPAASPSPTPPAYTTLELSPNPVTVLPNGTGSVEVIMNTNENTATGTQIELSYDPKAITNVVVTPGTFFQDPLIIPQWNKVDTQAGRISHAQVLQPSAAGIKGQGVIATIRFTKVPNSGLSQTQIQFMPKTAVTQSGINPSVLKSSTGATIYLGTPVNQAPPSNPTTPVQ